MLPDSFQPLPPQKGEKPLAQALPANTRDEAAKRLQIGLFGLAAVLLMIGLAKVVMDRANETDATAVPEAVEQVAGAPSATKGKDPLADAGVVPELPVIKPAPVILPDMPQVAPREDQPAANAP